MLTTSENIVAEPGTSWKSGSPAARAIGALVERAVAESGISCEIRLASGEALRFGDHAPQFTVTFRTDKALLAGLSEIALGEAYLRGDFEIEGDMFAMQEVRKLLTANIRGPISLAMLLQIVAMPATWINRKAINKHYHLDDDFFLSFIDRKYRFYSQCLFEHDDDSLEDAAERKLRTMWERLELKPGMRLLDIGGGWGGVHEYCGPRGVAVTSLTIAQNSYKYISELDRRLGLNNCTVKLEDFLVHRPAQPYDAVVNFGVMEHIPYYRRYAARIWEVLRSGGRMYLDASSSIKKYDVSDFTRKYIWTGAHSFMCVQDVLQELLFHGHEVLETINESHDYMLTMRAWAERFEHQRATIVSRWGEEIARIFRLYLWTGSYAFHDGSLQAYHVVTRKRSDRGPRPGIRERTLQFLRSFK